MELHQQSVYPFVSHFACNICKLEIFPRQNVNHIFFLNKSVNEASFMGKAQKARKVQIPDSVEEQFFI